MHNHLERNLIGYGPNPPDPQWPGEARVAVSFVLNYEEGGENCIVGGSYHDDLVRTPNGWRIKHRRLEQRWMDGNPNVLTLDKGTSKLAQAPAAHSLLVEVERYAGEVPEVTAHQPPVIIDREVLPAAE